MHSTWSRTLAVFTLLSLLLIGCTQEAPPGVAQANPNATTAPPASPTSPIAQPSPTVKPAFDIVMPGFSMEPTPQERIGAAILEAIALSNQKKFSEAIAALEAVKSLDDAGRVQREIDRITLLSAQNAAAERMVEDIEAILQSGRADEASRLAADGLREYGGTASAAAFTRLKLQADAILAGQMGNQGEVKKRLLAEGEAALQAKNLRAAAVAFEQALAQGEDADVKKKHEEVRAQLDKYNEFVQQAQAQRQDGRIDEAIAALDEAAKVWNPLELQQMLQEYRVLLQNRRERLTVAEFEVRGEVGIPEASRVLADELLPAFKQRFDLVERGQVDKVIAELKLQAGEIAATEQGREDFGRITGARYLVVGSISRLSGLTVHARLVDLKSGLIVQTARITAASQEDLLQKLPALGAMLQMSDEEKIALETKLQEQVKLPPPAPAEIDLPPAPEVPRPEETEPAPIINIVERPPEIGDIKPADLDDLPPAPVVGQPVAEPVIIIERDDPIKRRLFNITIELGDNLFRCGRFREAYYRFEFAYSLYPDYEPLRIRLDRCRPYLTPVVIVAPPPRLIVLDFLVYGRIHPALGAWVASDLAPYFSPPFEVVDRGELYWYMSRMGLTMRDLIFNPMARRWLGRAMNVRFFVFGVIRETASFDVHTHFMDAENGFVLGRGRMHVHNTHELKLRLRELAVITRMDSAERARYVRELPAYESFIIDGRKHYDRGEWVLAITFFKKARAARPNSVQAAFWLQQAEDRARRHGYDIAYRNDADRFRNEANVWEQRQLDLLRRSELERLQAERDWARRPEADRLRWNTQRERAFDDLIRQGRTQLRAENYAAAIRLFESAVQMDPRDEAFRELAAARAAWDEAKRRLDLEQQRKREEALRQQRARELAEAAAKLEEERRRREAEERLRTAARLERERELYEKFKVKGEKDLAAKNFAAAISAFQSARQIRRTKEIEELLDRALLEQQRDAARDAEAKRKLEERLAEEKRRREQAEQAGAKLRERFDSLLRLAEQALRDRRWDTAITSFEEAGKIQRTDAVVTGLRKARAGKDAETNVAKEEEARKLAAKIRLQEIERFLGEGKAALTANRLDDAIKAYRAVLERDSKNRDALAGLAKAETLKNTRAADERRKQEEAQRLASFNRLMDSGRTNLTAKRFEAAVQNFTDALRLNPGHKEAEDGLKKAVAGRDAAVTDKAEAEKRAKLYQKFMEEGRAALNLKRYDAAIRAFQEAQKVLPGDQASLTFLKEAERLKAQATSDAAAEAKKREEEQKRLQAIERALAAVRSAIAARNPTAARQALATLQQLSPTDPQIKTLDQQIKRLEDAARAEQDQRKKLLAEFEQHMRQGRAALQANRFDEAVAAFTRARQLFPDDKDAVNLLAQATKGRDEEQRKLAEAKRLAQLRNLLSDLQTAIKNRQLERANMLLAEAQKLAANDPQVRKLAGDVDALRKSLSGDALRKAQYDKAMQAGRNALSGKRYDEAIRDFQEALKLFAGDKDATTLLAQATRERDAANQAGQLRNLLTDAQAAIKNKQDTRAEQLLAQARKIAPNDPEVKRLTADLEQLKKTLAAETQRKADYDRAMRAGRDALASKRYNDAVRYFQEALQYMPNDKDAVNLLAQAMKERDKPKPDPKEEQYKQALAQAQTAEKQKNWAEAIRQYKQALDLKANDPTADAGWKRCRYEQAMQLGEAALKAKRFKEAATHAQEALAVRPKDPRATKLLNDATPK